MSLLIKKHTNTLIETTKTSPQETLEIKLNADSMSQTRSANRYLKTISFVPPIKLSEE